MAEQIEQAARTAGRTFNISLAELAGANAGQRNDLLALNQAVYRVPDGTLYTSTGSQLVLAQGLPVMAGTNPLTGGIEKLVAAGVDVPVVMTLAKSAIPITHTGTTNATVLATVNVPANSMGPNGSLRVTVYWSMTNNANNKRLLVRWGGTNAEMFNLNISAWAAASAMTEVSNRGATGSQIMTAGGTAASWGQLPGFNLASENTEVDQRVQIVSVLSNAADTLTIERYTVELLK